MQPYQQPYRVFVETHKRKRPLKPKKWLFPAGIEREYTRELYSLTNYLKELVKQLLLPKIESLTFEANLKAPEQPRNDDSLADLLDIMNLIRTIIEPKTLETQADAVAIGTQINRFNQAQFAKVTEAALTVDVFFDEPWLTEQLELFSTQNAELITSLVDDQITRVSGMVQRGFQQGLPYKTIQQQIQQTFGIPHRHAKLIARDQTVKLNASLTKLRQQDLGIETFEWQTSGDERVRASHRKMDGLICKWDDPTVYRNPGENKWRKRTSDMPKTQPGGDVQCRCVSLAIIDDL